MGYWMKRVFWGVLAAAGIDRRRNRHCWVYPERRKGWHQSEPYTRLVWR
jgi:hypothetical protein